jgi:hypothetical protein
MCLSNIMQQHDVRHKHRSRVMRAANGRASIYTLWGAGSPEAGLNRLIRARRVALAWAPTRARGRAIMYIQAQLRACADKCTLLQVCSCITAGVLIILRAYRASGLAKYERHMHSCHIADCVRNHVELLAALRSTTKVYCLGEYQVTWSHKYAASQHARNMVRHRMDGKTSLGIDSTDGMIGSCYKITHTQTSRVWLQRRPRATALL